MSTHTPRPWRFSRDEYGVKIYDKNGTKIAVVGGRYLYTDLEEIEEKNAHLIAAAPELLAALETANAALAYHPSGDNRNDEDIKAAKAAIAKAKGQELPR